LGGQGDEDDGNGGKAIKHEKGIGSGSWHWDLDTVNIDGFYMITMMK
jgi:hypothetical protein